MVDYSDGLEYLLDMDGTNYFLDDGRFYLNYSIKRVPKNPHIPHTIKYNLTLHDNSLKPKETRIFGMDNAHGGDYGLNKYSPRPVEWDHMHKNGETKAYKYINGYQLILDFEDGVKSTLNSIGFGHLFVWDRSIKN